MAIVSTHIGTFDLDIQDDGASCNTVGHQDPRSRQAVGEQLAAVPHSCVEGFLQEEKRPKFSMHTALSRFKATFSIKWEQTCVFDSHTYT